jgi:hypothetical protein
VKPNAHLPVALICLALAPRGAAALLRRLQGTHAAYAAVCHLLPEVPEAQEPLSSYELTHQVSGTAREL